MRHYIAIIVAGITGANGYLSVFTSGDDDLHNSIFRQKGWDLRRGAIQSLSAFSSAIDDGASTATSGVTTLTLLADDRQEVIGNRPIDIFARVGAESLSASQVWACDGLSASASSIYLRQGTAQTVGSRVLHVGTEAFLVSSSSIPASGNVAISARGYLQTVAMPHRANLSGFLQRTLPVTTVPVEWVGRGVYVYVDNVLWRIMVLTDNPHVDAHFVTLSMIDCVNVLSIQKKSCQVPAYSTTLTQRTRSESYRFDLIHSRPAINVPCTINGALRTDPATFGQNGILTGGSQINRDRLMLSFNWYQKHQFKFRYGWNGMPECTLRLIAEQEQALAYELPMTGGSGNSSPNPSVNCYLGPCRPSSDLDEFLNIGNLIFDLRRLELSAVTYWASCELSWIADNQSSDWDSPIVWNANVDRKCPWSQRFRTSGRISLRSRFAYQVGWPNVGLLSAPFAFGIFYRRNLNAADDPASLTNAPNPVDGLYAPWSQCDEVNASSGGPVALRDGSLPDYAHYFYPVRPRGEGALHNVVVTPKNVVLVLDADWWDRERTTGAIDIDYCDLWEWWEPGITEIWTTAEIPLSSTTGTVEIRWQEPSEEWLRALATVTHLSTSGGVSRYQIDPDVVMLDGSPCVGFGNWHGFERCQITPPTFVSAAYLGQIVARIIASTDSTSGRIADRLGDGFAIPISAEGLLSFEAMIPPGLGGFFRFAADDELSYNDFLELACRLTGSSIVGRLTDPTDLIAGWGPCAVPMGRPVPGEKRATWTDDDIIGIPTTADGNAGVVYTSYSITCGKRHWEINDWLAGDLLGQGDALEIDLTPILVRPSRVTDDSIEQLVGTLRDRYGVIRRRWSLRVPIELTIDLSVGDVVAITSAYLVDPAGGLGVSNRLARILSLTHDFTSAVSDVELIAYAEYGAGWSLSYDVQINSISSNSCSLTLLGATTPTTVEDQRRARDLEQYPPVVSSSVYYRLIQTEGNGASGIGYGYLTAWNAANRTATFYRSSTTSNPSLTAGNRGVLMLASYTTPAKYADLFALGRDRLL